MPVEMDQFEEVEPAVFEQYPAHTASTPTKIDWDDMLTSLEAGKIVRLPYADDAQLRRLRSALGRRATARGFHIETRHDQESVVIRRSSQPVVSAKARATETAATAEPRRARARRREQDRAEVAAQESLASEEA